MDFSEEKIITIKDDYQYVGFWPRVGASIIDSILLILIFSPLMSLLDLSPTFSSSEGALDLNNLLFNYALPIIATVLFWVYKSATPGKMVFSAYVIDEKTGNKPSIGQSILRYLGYYLSMLPLGGGFFWIIWDDKKQGWHDKIAGTVVVYKKNKLQKK